MSNTETAVQDGAGEISLTDIIAFGRRYFLHIFLSTALAIALTLGYVLTQPRVYQSYCSLFVTSSPGLGGSLLPAAAQEMLKVGGGSQSEYVMSILKSRTLQMKVADKLKLSQDESFWRGDKRRRNNQILLDKFSKLAVVSEKKGFVKVDVTTTSPKLSRDIAAVCLDVLVDKLVKETHTKQSFLETQLEESKVRLAASEDNLRKFQEKFNVVVPLEVQGKGEYQALLELSKTLGTSEAALLSLEERLNAPGNIETMIEFKSQEAGLRAEVKLLREMVEQRGKNLKGMPQGQVLYLRLVRDIKINEKIFEILTEQNKLAQIAEAGKDVPFKIVDRPEEADLPASRNLAAKLIGATLLGFLVGLMVALVSHWRKQPPVVTTPGQNS